MSKKQVMTKKKVAQEFLALTEKGEVKKAFDTYVADDFKHHNPRFKGDRETVIAVLQKTAKEFPEVVSKRIHTLEDGDLVTVYSHIKPRPNDKKDGGLAYVHIFRFDKDKIAEQWDFGTPVPTNPVNENGMF